MKIDLLYSRNRKPIAITVSGRERELREIRGLYLDPFKHRNTEGVMPLTPLSLKILREANPRLRPPPNMVSWYNAEVLRREQLAYALESKNSSSGNDPRLYDFQRRGVSFIEATGIRALLGDDPRLGKTVQALKAMELTNEYILHIFTMKSLVDYWCEMVSEWSSFYPIKVDGHSEFRRRVMAEHEVHNRDPKIAFVTNWESLRIVRGLSSQVNCVIGDECHIIRNRKAGVSKQFMKLRPRSLVLMSATMIERGPQDYFPMLRVLRPHEFTSYWRWVGWYCETVFNGFGHSIVGAKNEDLLHDHMAPFSLRRRADEVSNVPKKVYERLPVSPSVELMDAYRKIEKEVLVELGSTTLTIPNALARMVRLRQLSTAPRTLGLDFDSPKIPTITEYIENLPTDMQFVIYTSFRSAAKKIARVVPSCELFVGGMPSPVKFLRGKKRGLVCTPQLGGIGQDYSCADVIIYADLPQSSTILRQSIERTTKIGIKKPRMIVLVSCTPIDRAIAQALRDKQEAIKDVDIYNYIMSYLNN